MRKVGVSYDSSLYLSSGDAVVGMASSGMLHYCGRECSKDREGHC